ncbi:MAG: NADH-quinone oxidoreductase subunit A [Planctomycetota bacterium]
MNVILYLGVSIIMVIGLLIVGEILGKKKPTTLKKIPFECGIIPKEISSQNFGVPYFGYAILFLIFDVDIVIFYFLIGAKISLIYFTLIFLFVLLGFLGIWFSYKLGVFRWE